MQLRNPFTKERKMKKAKKSVFASVLVFVAMALSACGHVVYEKAPVQFIAEDYHGGVVVYVVNNSFGGVEFFDGALAGLTLAPRQCYKAQLRMGTHEIGWNQYVPHKARVIDYHDRLIISSRTKVIAIPPSPRDDLYYVDSWNHLQTRDYLTIDVSQCQ